VARNNTTGRLSCFKTDNLDIKAISNGDAVSINLQSKKITGIGGAVRNYNITQPDNAEPVNILAAMQIDNAGTINSIVTTKINSLDPCCSIVSIEPDPLDPCCAIVSFKKSSTGVLSKFQVPKNISKTIKFGDPVYAEPINEIVTPKINNAEPITGFAIVQSSYGSSNGQMASYGYPVTSGDGATANANETAKWVISPVSTMKGVLGRLDINYPPGVDRWILYYQPADNKYMGSVSNNDKIFTITPGAYRFLITDVPVENVPIQKGHETRIKMGFLNVVSEGGFYLYNDTKEKLYTTYDKPKKIALPVGNYQVKLGGQFYPFTIKDKETVEY
jgi:hypothetical protein